MIQSLSSWVGGYSSQTLNSSSQMGATSLAPQTEAQEAQSVITIERGNGVYQTYLRNGVVQKLQYVGSSLSKCF